MPRSTKESDDEFEPRGRRTRATASSVTDSPLRRSTRRRATTKDDSSPEPVTSDVGPSTRAKRRITPTLESTHVESVRNLRSRKTSTTSDVSEATESDTGSEAKRRTTRRSSLALSGIETPTKARLRRTIRAGSESKTISPMVRLTRRTRASSVDPEATDERAPMTPSTPLHTRKGRASTQPSELPVLEEIQKHEKDVPHEDDDVFLTQSSPSKLSAPSPKTPVAQKSTPTVMHKNEESMEAPHEALNTSTTSRTPQDSADTRQKLMDTASGNTLNDIPKVLVEKAHVKVSPGNKENEKTPKSTRDHSSKLFKATGGDRKSLSSTVLERLDVDSRSNIDGQLSKSKSPSVALEKVITLESDVSEKKGLEEKEGSIIFIDDTDTDEAPVEVFRNDKSTNKGLNHDEIIIADAGSNEISPCKSQTPEGDSPGVDSKPEIIEENFKEVEQVEDQVEAELKDLFKDIPADNWKSGGSKSPVDIEDEDKSDTGSDIVLVGWSADENELEEKTKKNFNYDSDDTVIIQKRKQSSAGRKGSLDHGGEENKNLQRKSGKSLNLSTGDDVDELGEKSRKGTRKSLRKSQNPAEEESVNSDVEDELNKSRDLIYRFESGIINFEENFDESKRKSDVDSQGKHPEGSESRVSLSGGRKSTGKSGNNDQGENAKAEESPDKSRKSIPLSEVRKSLEKAKNPVEEEIDDEAMDVDVVGDDEMEISDYHPKESPQVDASGDELIEVDGKPEAGEMNSKPSETLISSSNGVVHEGHSMSPKVSESASTLRRSALRNSINEGRAEGVAKEKEKSATVEEATSEVDNVSNKARRSSNQSELRVSLCKINTPVKQQEMSSLEKHEELLLEDKSENVSRKSLSVSKTPTKVQQDDEKSSSEDEDPEDITKKFNKSKEELIESPENVESSLEETSALESNDTSKTGETLKKCERSLRRSLNQSKAEDDEKASHQQRNSLAVEISSLANTQEDEDEQKDNEGIPEGEETLNKSQKSLRRSSYAPEADEGDDKVSPQKRKSLTLEESTLEKPRDEESVGVEGTLYKLRRSLRKSMTQSKQDESENSEISKEVSPQKGNSMAVDALSEGEGDDDDDEDDENTPELEALQKSWRDLRKSLNESNTLSIEKDDQESNESEETSQKRKSTSEEEDEVEEAPGINESLTQSRKSLNKSLNKSKTPVKKNDDILSKKSPKISSQNRKSLATEKSSSEEEDENEGIPEIEKSLDKSRKSLEKSLIKSKTPVKNRVDELSKKSPKISSQNRKSLATEKSSSEEEEENEEIPEIEKSLDTSRKSLQTSLIKSTTPVKKSINDLSKKSPKISPQKRKSLATEKSSEEEEKDEETPEIEVSLNKSRKSMEKSASKSKTPVKTSVDDLPKKSPKTSLQKRKSLTVEESLSSDEEADEEIFNKSTKSLRRSVIESKTPSKQKDTEQSQKTPKTRLQTRKSLVLEKSQSSEEEEEALEVEESLSKSTSTLRRSQIESKTPSKQNEEGSKASPKPSPQKRRAPTLGASSSSSEDDEKESEDLDEQRSLSTQVQVNSNSDPDEDIDSDIEQSRVVVSSLLYDDDSETSNSDMNSDIEKEYNLNGADVEEYSDDGIPGDDLRKSDSEESDSDEEEDDEDEFDDFINDDEEEEEDEDESEENEEENEEDVEDHEDETVEIDDEEEEVFVSPPKPTKKGHEKLKLKETKKSNSESLEDTSGNSSLETGKSESTKKNKKKTSEVRTSVKPSVSSPSKFSGIAAKLPKSVASLKESKLEKKSKVNLTMSLNDPDLADTRLLMKEKLNDSMPILNMKRLSSRRSDLQVLPEDKEEKKKTKSKGKKHSISEKLTEKSEEVTVSISDKKSKKTNKLNNSEQSNATNESTKRKKSKEVDLEITSDVPRLKKKKVQVEQLADSDSDDGAEVPSFTRGRDQALAAAKGQQESIKAAKETKKSHKKMKGAKPENPSVVSRKPIEQLPQETLSNLSDIPLRPKRKREINDDVFVPTKTMFDVKNKKPKTMSIDDEFVPLSLSGGTTTFEVVTLKEKKGKKTSPVRSFKERMMNRVPRQPTSAYMVYQRKLQASGKNKY